MGVDGEVVPVEGPVNTQNLVGEAVSGGSMQVPNAAGTGTESVSFDNLVYHLEAGDSGTVETAAFKIIPSATGGGQVRYKGSGGGKRGAGGGGGRRGRGGGGGGGGGGRRQDYTGDRKRKEKRYITNTN